MIADALHELEAFFKTKFIEVIEKYTADAAWLVPVLDEKILVAPFLEARVILVTERGERIPASLVEMHAIRLKAVVGR